MNVKLWEIYFLEVVMRCGDGIVWRSPKTPFPLAIEWSSARIIIAAGPQTELHADREGSLDVGLLIPKCYSVHRYIPFLNLYCIPLWTAHGKPRTR